MGILLRRQIDEHSLLGIWEINETIEVLYNQLTLNDEEQLLYDSFRTNQRRMHWLSYRVLTKNILKDNIKSICYDENGKPFLNNSKKNISVTHSGKFSAMIVGNKPVGIDIEQIQPKIMNICDKFMSYKELEQIDKSHNIEQLYIYWSAKEALYKLYGKKNLMFKENIIIKGFPFKTQDIIKGKIITSSFEKEYSLYYEYIEDYSLVYVVD